MATADNIDHACAICQLEDEDTCGTLIHLACAHAFHKECLDTYTDVRGQSDAELQCPICKLKKLGAIISAPPSSVESSSGLELIESPAVTQPSASTDSGAANAPQSTNNQIAMPKPKSVSESLGLHQPVMSQLHRLSDASHQMVLCNSCGGKVELEKAIIRGKQTGTFRCKVCHSKCELMRRKCGGFPPDVFAAMTEQQKQDFFNKTQSTKSALQSQLASIRRSFKRNEKVWACGGEFRPLGYWKTMGYDEERIAANSDPDDVRECRIAGTVYRVPVMSHGERSSEVTEEINEQRVAQAPAKRLQLKSGTWVSVTDTAYDDDDSEQSSSAHGDAKVAFEKKKESCKRCCEGQGNRCDRDNEGKAGRCKRSPGCEVVGKASRVKAEAKPVQVEGATEIVRVCTETGRKSCKCKAQSC